VRGVRAALAVAAGLLLALLALAGGVGWLYVLYRGGQLALGPRVPDALPLEALAGHAAQPLLRFAVAWLTVGAAVGLVLRGARMDARAALPAFAVASALVLVAAGAVSDALTVNQRVVDHITPQLAATANLAAWAALVAGALGAQVSSRRWQRASSRSPATGSALRSWVRRSAFSRRSGTSSSTNGSSAAPRSTPMAPP
jgi:hypothetical protein